MNINDHFLYKYLSDVAKAVLHGNSTKGMKGVLKAFSHNETPGPML